jgi:hypothetical protein
MVFNCFLRHFPCPRKQERGEGNGADDNRVRTGEGWEKQDVRVRREIGNNLTKNKGVWMVKRRIMVKNGVCNLRNIKRLQRGS